MKTIPSKAVIEGPIPTASFPDQMGDYAYCLRKVLWARGETRGWFGVENSATSVRRLYTGRPLSLFAR